MAKTLDIFHLSFNTNTTLLGQCSMNNDKWKLGNGKSELAPGL
jgi:hypothetical protein